MAPPSPSPGQPADQDSDQERARHALRRMRRDGLLGLAEEARHLVGELAQLIAQLRILSAAAGCAGAGDAAGGAAAEAVVRSFCDADSSS